MKLPIADMHIKANPNTAKNIRSGTNLYELANQITSSLKYNSNNLILNIFSKKKLKRIKSLSVCM